MESGRASAEERTTSPACPGLHQAGFWFRPVSTGRGFPRALEIAVHAEDVCRKEQDVTIEGFLSAPQLPSLRSMFLEKLSATWGRRAREVFHGHNQSLATDVLSMNRYLGRCRIFSPGEGDHISKQLPMARRLTCRRGMSLRHEEQPSPDEPCGHRPPAAQLRLGSQTHSGARPRLAFGKPRQKRTRRQIYPRRYTRWTTIDASSKHLLPGHHGKTGVATLRH